MDLQNEIRFQKLSKEIRLVVKGYNQKRNWLYKKPFHRITKNSFRVIITIVVHINLKIHQMDIKIIFLNSNLYEDLFIIQLIKFENVDKEGFVCKLNKSMYIYIETSFKIIVSKIW